MTLRPLFVKHLDQIERVRLIRNECAAGFSNYTDQIAEGAHWAWWEREKPLAWLYARPDGIVVGFGMLRQDEQGRWVTVVAVLPEYGGQGHGKAITHDIVTRSPGPCFATARRDNPAAVKLHVTEDWETISGPDPRLVYFRTRAIWPPREAVEQWTVDGWVTA